MISRWHVITLACATLCLAASAAAAPPSAAAPASGSVAQKRVAIIGSGIGGAAAAHWLAKEGVDVTVFEQAATVGGRLRHRMYGQTVVEEGGGIIHSVNTYVSELIDELGLKRRNRKLEMREYLLNATARAGGPAPVPQPARSGYGGLGMWNGKALTIAGAGDDSHTEWNMLTFSGADLIHRWLWWLLPAVPPPSAAAAPTEIGWFDALIYRAADAIADACTKAGMLLRYGLSLIRASSLVSASLARWQTVYDWQSASNRTVWSSPAQLFESLELLPYTQAESGTYFNRIAGLSDLLIDEYVTGVTRVNYNQNGRSVNAMCNLISMAGAGMVGELYSVVEGNVAIVQRILTDSPLRRKHQNIHLRLNTSVTRITGLRAAANGGQQRRSGYELSFTHTRAGGDSASSPAHGTIDSVDGTAVFDAVIIATPLELTALQFDAASLADAVAALPRETNREFQRTHATFVAGTPNPDERLTFPDVIVTVECDRIPFSSFAFQGFDTANGETIYKLFSRERISDAVLNQLFHPIPNASANANAKPNRSLDPSAISRVEWDAYPVLTPRSPSAMAPFLLDGDGLCYLNALESVASAMEISAVAAKNCVYAALRHLNSPTGSS